MRLYSLLGLVGLVGLLDPVIAAVGDACSDGQNTCGGGINCNYAVCGGYQASCAHDRECLSGNCAEDDAGYTYCTAKYNVGDRGCTPGGIGGSGLDGSCQNRYCNATGYCGGDGAFTSARCDGPCLDSSCASGFSDRVGTNFGKCVEQHQLKYGEACLVDPQCPAGASCKSGFCGGQGSCRPDTPGPNFSGPSSVCTNGAICIGGRCAQPYARGHTCLGSECNSGVACTNGICGGPGACDPTVPTYGPGSGASPTCGSNSICLQNQCFRLLSPGTTCTSSPQCAHGLSCTDGVCGGANACTPDDTSITDGYGPSSRCTNGNICQAYQCGPKLTKGQSCVSKYQCPAGTCISGLCGGGGESCSTNNQCISELCFGGFCVSGGGSGFVCSKDSDCPSVYKCGPNNLCGQGTTCTPDRPSYDNSGVSRQCDSEFSCYSGICQLSGVTNLGGACDDTHRCNPSYHCIHNKCDDRTLLGPGACYTDDPTLTNGPSVDCPTTDTWTCNNNLCTRAAGPAEACSASVICLDDLTCTDGICTGPGVCSPDDGSTDGTGLSAQCSTGQYCQNHMCTNQASLGGGPCTSDFECSQGSCAIALQTCGGPGATCSSGTDCASNYCDARGLCGGGNPCDPDIPSGDGSGASTYCGTGLSCYYQTCLAPGTVGLGGSCDSNVNLCQPQYHCIDGVCKDEIPNSVGNSCDDNGVNGPCVGSICVDGTCVLDGPQPSTLKRSELLIKNRRRCLIGGQIACPIANSRSLDAYECLDPMTNIESCGGCVFGDGSIGQDCTALLNTMGVACTQGVCEIESCIEGYKLGESNQSCVIDSDSA